MSESGARGYQDRLRNGIAGGAVSNVVIPFAIAVCLFPQTLAAAQQHTQPDSGSTAIEVGDTLFLVGDARIDRNVTVLWSWDPAAARAAWRRALGFVSWTRGSVLSAAGADNYRTLERHDPLLADSVAAAVRDGAWAPVVGGDDRSALWSSHGETIIRQLLHDQAYFQRTFGERPRVAWLSGGRYLPTTLPQILVGLGVDAVLAGRYTGSGGDPGLRGPFEWIGNDGTGLFGYVPFDYGDFADFEFEFPGPVAEPGAAGRHRIALYGVRDPGWEAAGGPGVAHPVTGADRPAAVKFASPEHALGAVRESTAGTGLPVLRGELMVAGHAPGLMTAPPSGQPARIAITATGLQTAEALAAVVAGLPGASPYPDSRLERSWRQLFAGTAILSQPVTEDTRLSGSAGDAVARASLDSAGITIDSMISEQFAALRRQMDTRAAKNGSFVLFNPLGHPRSGATFVEIGRGDEPRTVAAAAAGRDLLLISLPDVPAFGAVSLPIGPDGLPGVTASGLQPPTAGSLWMENSFLRIEIDPASGAISQILDKTNGRQALRPAGRANVLRVRADSKGVENPSPVSMESETVRRDGPGEITRLLSLSSSVSARAARITLERGWRGSTIRQQLVLGRAARFLEVSTEIDWREVGWSVDVSFDPVVQPSTATFEIPYGTTLRATRDDELHGLPMGRWSSVSDGGYGVSVITDRSAAWDYAAGKLRLSGLTSGVPDSALSEYRFAIYPHAGDWLEAGTHQFAAEYAVPLLSAIEPPHNGRLGERFSLLSTGNPMAGLEWLKRAENEDVFVVRMVNWGAVSTEAQVETACTDVAAWSSNHLEERGPALPASRSGFRVRLRANEIATVLVECRS